MNVLRMLPGERSVRQAERAIGNVIRHHVRPVTEAWIGRPQLRADHSGAHRTAMVERLHVNHLGKHCVFSGLLLLLAE